MDYEEYKKELEKNNLRNDELLKKFKAELEREGLTDRTISKHLMNIDFYINNYLTYYEVILVEEGILGVMGFFSDFFKRKAMWSDESAVKATITALKKFYGFLLKEELVSKEDYQMLKDTIKSEKSYWIEVMNDYNSFEDDY